ncbi:MAG: flavodoxin family protein [Thermoleophilia bacterium]|jgi:multimeric flavodoxin WrbA
MKILGIVGSPRKNGNTQILVEKSLETAAQLGATTRLVMLRDQHIEFCRGCEACARNHKCVIDDDMQALYPLLLEADGLILGSPVHFYNISSSMKTFIDRCYCLEAFDRDDRSCWVGFREALGGGYAVVITVAEQAQEEYSGFAVEAMSRPLADLGYRVVETVAVRGLWSRGEAEDDPEAMSMAAQAGERLTKIIRLRRSLDRSLDD